MGANVGGLSKAFRPPFATASSRTLSLHNLLDLGAMGDAAAAVTAAAGGGGSSGAASSSSLAGATSPPAPAPSKQGGGGGGGRRSSLDEKDRRVGKAGQWGRKQEVIDGVNDLIQELKDIDDNIAAQARKLMGWCFFACLLADWMCVVRVCAACVREVASMG